MKKFTVPFLAVILCCLLSACRQEEQPQCSHQFLTKVSREASCSETGILEHTCQNCGLSFSQVTPTGEHSFTETVTKEATAEATSLKEKAEEAKEAVKEELAEETAAEAADTAEITSSLKEKAEEVKEEIKEELAAQQDEAASDAQ